MWNWQKIFTTSLHLYSDSKSGNLEGSFSISTLLEDDLCPPQPPSPLRNNEACNTSLIEYCRFNIQHLIVEHISSSSVLALDTNQQN